MNLEHTRSLTEEIKAEVERICGGKPAKPRLLDHPVAVVKWVDGTVLDTVWQVVDDNPYAPKRSEVDTG